MNIDKKFKQAQDETRTWFRNCLMCKIHRASINALKDENVKLKEKIKKLEKQIEELEDAEYDYIDQNKRMWGEKMIKRIWNYEITIGQLLVGGILDNMISYFIIWRWVNERDNEIFERGEKMKGIIPFSCIKDLDEIKDLFEQAGHAVTVEKNYIRVEEESQDEKGSD